VVFSSMIFLWLFLPLTLILYQLCAVTKNLELKNTLLLLASLLFYSFGDFRYLPLLLVCAGVNYAAGLVMDRRPGLKKPALAGAVLLSLGLLAYYKYAGFFVLTVNGAAGRELLPFKEIALPIGISFYTFQALSYTIDLYRGRCDVQKRFDRLLLYVAFFPQLIAGPIVRYRDVAEQIAERRVDAELFASGVRRFVAGLGKKVILANIYAEAADRVFALDSLNRTPAIAWYGILLTPCRSTSISAATPTWPSAWGACSASASWRTLTCPTPRKASPSSGEGGTSPCPPGSRSTCTSPWAGTGGGSSGPA